MMDSKPTISLSLLSVLDSIINDHGFPSIQFVLASQSPRRREIMKLLGLSDVIVLPSSFEENLKKSDFSDARLYAEQTARLKGENVIQHYFKKLTSPSEARVNSPELLSSLKEGETSGNALSPLHPNTSFEDSSKSRICDPLPTDYSIIIAADTIVEANGHIYEKPKSKQEAKAMLEIFSGSYHSVHTGVALFLLSKKSEIQAVRVFSNSTKVYFRTLHPVDIETYIKSEEPYDKAGGYALQGTAAQFIQRIDGCYYTVIGLPLEAVSVHLADIIMSLRAP